MAQARDKGHEVGLLGLSPQSWARRLAYAEADWVEHQCARLWERFAASGLEAPCSFATPDWQVHPRLFRELTPTRYRYSTLTRGKLPYFPVLQGVRSPIPEIPTTLPTVDELLRQGVEPPVRFIGKSTKDISVNDMIWAFFKQHR